jgi:hypothetical protein
MTNCRQLAEGIPVRLCLSGEMALQQPQALLSQLDLLDRLAGLGGFPAYTRRYCSAEWKEKKRVLGGASNLAELENALRATCLLCRRKRDVAGQLDPKPS